MNLIIFTKDPYESAAFAEAVDLVYAMAAFEQDIHLVFCDNALLALRPGHQTDGIESRSMEKKLAALPVYGVEKISYLSSNTVGNQLGADKLDQNQFSQLMSEATNIQVF